MPPHSCSIKINLIFYLIVVVATTCYTLGMVNCLASNLKNHDVYIVATDDNDFTKNIIKKIQFYFPSAKTIDSTNLPPTEKLKPIYLAIGPFALKFLYEKNVSAPIFSIYITSDNFRRIIHNENEKNISSITAIYADPAPENQFKLISILHKKILSAAVLISDETEYLRPTLIQAAEKNSLSLILENISGRNNINYALNNIKYIPFLLAIPDENIYSPESIKNILITTYRHNQPMIGYSSALVKAGALASIHSDISEIITQMDEQLTEYDKTGKWPAPQFPKYFHVVINEDVARSFNITIENDVRKFSYPTPSDES